MSKQQKTLFISDLHLEENHPQTTEAFLQLLKNRASEMDALYILGDLFETWIGDDDQTSFHLTIIQALKNATQQGLPIYFMRGNRDFLIGKRFLHETGCQLLHDEEKIMLYGIPILLMHGDTLCTEDKNYLRWRKKARNPILNTLFFLALPLRFRRYIANQLRKKSMQYTLSTSVKIMDVTQSAVQMIMQKHRVQYLIHGHTHQPNIHQFAINDIPHTRIVLSAWDNKASYLVWEETGEYHLS